MTVRLVGEHFTAKGKPKEALTQVQAERRAITQNMHAYECGVCGAWHIATRPARQSGRRRRRGR